MDKASVSQLRYWATCLKGRKPLTTKDRLVISLELCKAAEEIERANKAKDQLSYWLHS